MSRTDVIVRKLKFDGSVRYEWDGELLDELDGWAVVLHDSARHEKRESHTSAVTSDAGLGLHYIGFAVPVSVLFSFDGDGKFVDAKCDAAFPAVRRKDYLDFVDLDLDVIVLPGLHHYVRDQDVFAERSVTMAYTDEVKRTAHNGILHSLRMVRRRQFPFDGQAEETIQKTLGGTPRRK